MRREGELRREYLLNKAKILQTRATKHKARVSGRYVVFLHLEREREEVLQGGRGNFVSF